MDILTYTEYLTREDRAFYPTEKLHKHIAYQMSKELNKKNYIHHNETAGHDYDEILIRSKLYIVTPQEYYELLALREIVYGEEDDKQ